MDIVENGIQKIYIKEKINWGDDGRVVMVMAGLVVSSLTFWIS
jgi:mannitol/fructose-specific phosphotransferase system IIA component